MRRVLPALLAVALAACPAALAAGAGDWPEFGFDPTRADAAPAGGVSAGDLGRLRRQVVRLPGTVDSSPIALAGVSVRGRARDVLVVTTTYGRTLALDAASGRVLWQFVPPGIGGWEGSAQITTATPVADPDRRSVYAASPDGRIWKLALASGRPVWGVSITRDPTHEKIASALNLLDGRVIATTGGYFGDAPPYQGHVLAIDARTGRILHVWSSLCSDRVGLIEPSTCPSSGSAIWGRAGAVVEPGSGRLLVATGNGPWNGRTDWGDSVLELAPDASSLRQSWTPRNEAELERSDRDLGSTSPLLLPALPGTPRVVVQGGKDGLLRLLRLANLNGSSRGAGPVRGGELQTIPAPGRADVFTAPAAVRDGSRVLVFVATNAGTGAFELRAAPRPRLRPLWSNDTGGTSPVLAGSLLYVYDPGGGLNVYRAADGRRLARLAAGPGHWSSPIVAGGRIALPEGDANAHATTGVLDIWRVRS